MEENTEGSFVLISFCSLPDEIKYNTDNMYEWRTRK